MQWQVWPLFAVGGIFAALWPLESLLCVSLLLVLDRRIWQPGRLLAALLCCAAGYGVASWLTAVPQTPP